MVLTLLLTVSFSGWLTASAQQRTVTVNGVVLDENGSPMVGVTVVDSKKPTVGTTSGAQGNFAIIVGRDCDSLRFSFIGYIPQTVSVRNAALVRMKPDLQDIGEVVVTGIYTRKAESYTGAARTLSNKELTRVGNQNALQSLKNLDPTIYIPNNMTMGSDPNTLPSISMRGTSSFPASESSISLRSKYDNQPNQPLFILDGFETSIETVMDMDMNRIFAPVTMQSLIQTLENREIQRLQKLQEEKKGAAGRQNNNSSMSGSSTNSMFNSSSNSMFNSMSGSMNNSMTNMMR